MPAENPKATAKVIELINTLKLDTERLKIRKFGEQDIEANVRHEMNPELMQYIRDPVSEDETRQKSHEVAQAWSGQEQQWSLLSVRLQDNQDFAGVLSFRYESIANDTIELGWRLHSDYHGKGYASEAAKALLQFIKNNIKPHKVVAYCTAENTASSNLMKKLGMTQEGRLRQFCKLNGKWCDEDIYGLVLD